MVLQARVSGIRFVLGPRTRTLDPYVYFRGLEKLETFWSQIPDVAFVSFTSNFRLFSARISHGL